MRRPHVQQQALLDATHPKGRRLTGYLPGIDPAMLPMLIEHAQKITPPFGHPALPSSKGSSTGCPRAIALRGTGTRRSS